VVRMVVRRVTISTEKRSALVVRVLHWGLLFTVARLRKGYREALRYFWDTVMELRASESGGGSDGLR
jgi:hypothetical protein